MVFKRERTPEQLEGMVSSGVYAEGVGTEEVEEMEGDNEGSVQMELDEEVVETGSVAEVGVVNPVEVIKEGEEVVQAEKMKMDVIAMIRKSKSKPTTVVQTRNEVAANDDFISFGFSDDEKAMDKHTEDHGLDEDHGRKSRKVNDGGRVESHSGASRDKGFSHREAFHQYLDEKAPPLLKGEAPPSGVDLGPPGAAGATVIGASLPPPPGLSTLPIGGKAPDTAVPGGIVFSLPQKPPPPSLTAITPTLSTWPPPPADIITITSSPSPPPQSATHGKKRKLDDTSLTAHLTPVGLAPQYMLPRNSQKNPTPWLLHDHSRTLHPSDLLHKEIHDFLTYIRPRRYEHAVRRHVIQRIRTAITDSIYDVDVRVFGSFASGMYLPTSDLDLAVISREFARTGKPKYAAKNTLYRVSTLLRRAGIPKDDKVVVISSAKVPIIKFVDRLSGLQVDICFENLSGVTANRTFRKWREEYPAMPALAMIVKQFLELRGQNEVYIGGLGGFTVICLVISLLQLHPGFSSGNIPIEKNLGVGLMEFFELYGYRFDTSKVGIDVSTSSYFRKSYVPAPRFGDTKSKEYKEYWILHIIDPNDPTNNISKSSYGVKEIFRTFAEGFGALESRMSEFHKQEFGDRKGGVLGAILGGNYDVVEKQRALMRRVYEEVYREKAVEDDSFGEDGGVVPWRWEWDAELAGEGGGEGWVVDVKGVEVGGGAEAENLKNRKAERKGKKGTSKGKEKRADEEEEEWDEGDQEDSGRPRLDDEDDYMFSNAPKRPRKKKSKPLRMDDGGPPGVKGVGKSKKKKSKPPKVRRV